MQIYYYIISWISILAIICLLIIIIYKSFFSSKSSVFINIMQYIILFLFIMCLVLKLSRHYYRVYCDNLFCYLIVYVPYILMIILWLAWNRFVMGKSKNYKKWQRILLYLFAFIMLAFFCLVAYNFYKFGVNYNN